ncbi:MAG: hypothetical protein EBU84_03660 [Actinobacteria bacterium]|nr:hypothetical protein [Actinomycetota bacterium]
MLHVSYIIPNMALWHLVFSELSKHKPQAVSKNINHLLHSLVFLLHYCSDHDLQYATHLSLGFYMYDTVCLMQTAAREFCLASTEKIMHRRPSAAGSSQAPFLLHHAIGIYMLATALTAPEHTTSLLRGFYILETSNIMLYVSYHVRKEHAARPALIAASELVQLVWYAYYRIFKLTPMLYETRAEALTRGIGAVTMLGIIYAMGAVWSYRLLIKNVHNYRAMMRVGHL